MSDDGHDLLQFDAAWGDFCGRIPAKGDLWGLSHSCLASQFKVSSDIISVVIPRALEEWRVSPTRSLVHCLDNVTDTVPQGKVFSSLIEQTQFCIKAVELGLLSRRDDLYTVMGQDGRPVRLDMDHYALAIRPEAAVRANNIIRSFRAWELRNRDCIASGAYHVPKLLYRGIRLADIKADPAIQRGGIPRYYWAKEHTEAKIRNLTSTPLTSISHSPILSFTSSEQVAEIYTKKKGVIATVSPGEVDIVASCLTDQALASKDQVIDRYEREWIVRLPASLRLRRENVRIHDEEYLMAINDPLSVSLFSHDSHRARYTVGNHRVDAKFSWASCGTKGSLTFVVDDNYCRISRAKVRKLFGFDPLPTNANMDSIKNFELFENDLWGRCKRPLDIPGPSTEEEEPTLPFASL